MQHLTRIQEKLPLAAFLGFSDIVKSPTDLLHRGFFYSYSQNLTTQISFQSKRPDLQS